ncbi:unnamed protein product, partial [Adineta steineri]
MTTVSSELVLDPSDNAWMMVSTA